MADQSTKLSLPYILPSQAQKHVTHNEAVRALDTLVQLSLEAVGATTPPSTPVEGAAYGLSAVPDGAWSGQGGDIAVFVDGAWRSTHHKRVGAPGTKAQVSCGFGMARSGGQKVQI